MGSRRKIIDINWSAIEEDYNNGFSKAELYVKYNTTPRSFKKAEGIGLLNIVSRTPSENIKNNLRKNPDNHSWKKNTKFVSKPCEKVKEFLQESGINFIPEYTPLEDRFFSIDIAFPDKKIGIEINGNQHYNKDGSLKYYYQNRHDLITNSGWKLYEYHYSIAYDMGLLNKIVFELKTNYNLGNIDYSFYIMAPKLKVYKPRQNKCECGKLKDEKAINCIDCYNKHIRPKKRKVKDRPSLEQLELEVNQLGYRGTGKKYGVSDNCIRNWIKVYKV